MNQTLKSAIVAAVVSGAIAAPTAGAFTYSQVDQRQDRQIRLLRSDLDTYARTFQATDDAQWCAMKNAGIQVPAWVSCP